MSCGAKPTKQKLLKGFSGVFFSPLNIFQTGPKLIKRKLIFIKLIAKDHEFQNLMMVVAMTKLNEKI